jgi:MoaA/NifB/PqqE/SkfB family radical SAM enzyme
MSIIRPGLRGSLAPTRIVLNFAHRCNMSCEWCYVPFMGELPDADICLRIVERSAQIGFRVITLAGGDPLLYSFLPQLIESAKKCGLLVHLDTNGIGLRCTDETVSQVIEPVDLLGLPLDGPRAEIHNRMRSTQSHFELVLDRLDWLAPFMHKVKINTFVSIKNADAIAEMVPLVKTYGPSRWSLYQYWPLSLGGIAFGQHFISNDQFSGVVDEIPALIGPVRVEVNPLPLRRLTYPFVSHEGFVYLHHQTDQSNYESLGPIFDDAVVAELFERCGTERENAISRYLSNGTLAS